MAPRNSTRYIFCIMSSDFDNNRVEYMYRTHDAFLSRILQGKPGPDHLIDRTHTCRADVYTRKKKVMIYEN